jgi:hypothetical protein
MVRGRFSSCRTTPLVESSRTCRRLGPLRRQLEPVPKWLERYLHEGRHIACYITARLACARALSSHQAQTGLYVPIGTRDSGRKLTCVSMRHSGCRRLDQQKRAGRRSPETRGCEGGRALRRPRRSASSGSLSQEKEPLLRNGSRHSCVSLVYRRYLVPGHTLPIIKLIRLGLCDPSDTRCRNAHRRGVAAETRRGFRCCRPQFLCRPGDRQTDESVPYSKRLTRSVAD